MLTLDGSTGEGGGQILRTALGLSVATRTPFRIDAIRGARRRPGLLRQHLTAVRAAQTIGSAKVQGAELGSSSLTFEPTALSGGERHFAIGSAGSTTLVLQTILPALLAAPEPTQVTIEGGTHNQAAPPFEFMAHAFVPLLERAGARVEIRLDRHGFHPAGGGQICAKVDPTGRPLEAFELMDRGPIQSRGARALVAQIDGSVGQRELARVTQRLGLAPAEVEVCAIDDSPGPGNVLLIEIACEHVTEVFAGYGALGLRAEVVADRTIRQARRYLASEVPVGPYLADQLLLPLALAGGGAFRTSPPSQHALTNAEVISQFLPVDIAFDVANKDCVVRVLPR